MIDDNKLCQLMSMFPDHNFENLKQVLINCNGEVQSALVILSSNGDLNGGKGQQGKSITSATHHLNKKKNGSTQNHKYYIGTSSNNRIYDDDDNDGLVDYE